ncbi:MAG: hypothetical protein ACOC0U_03680 [Desulfovibrionales bacterium]
MKKKNEIGILPNLFFAELGRHAPAVLIIKEEIFFSPVITRVVR